MSRHFSRAPSRDAERRPGAGLYESITAAIVGHLERGVVPWRKPWHTIGAMPMNAVSKRPYRGVNVLLLTSTAFRDFRWLTYLQAQELGGHVRKGERATTCVLWKPWESEETDEETGATAKRRIPLLRTYSLFNVEQCDGLGLPDLPTIGTERAHTRVEAAEAILAAMPDPPTIRETGSAAWYRPSDDVVQVPPLGAFRTVDAFYGTLFHELGHATGHERRLARPGVTGEICFGSSEYSREELVAELSSAFLCGIAGLDNSYIADSASYIHGWMTVLQADPKAIVVASAQAQRAADHIMIRSSTPTMLAAS